VSNATGIARPTITKSGRSPSPKKLVFGLLDKGNDESNLVFIQEKEATRLAQVHDAIRTSKTWGTFCRKMPASDLKYVTDNLLENGESLPGKRDRFDGCCDSSLPPSYFDGDWPDWPEQTMLHFMPPAIVKKYGQTPCSVLNGFYLVLKMSNADEILTALERKGFRCRLDEKLVRKACGRSGSSKMAL
jgi:hypothetical protein